MKSNNVLELRVGVDVGCHNHNVAIGLLTGKILEEFYIVHTQEGFRKFFLRIEHNEKTYGCPVAVAMEVDCGQGEIPGPGSGGKLLEAAITASAP